MFNLDTFFGRSDLSFIKLVFGLWRKKWQVFFKSKPQLQMRLENPGNCARLSDHELI